MIKNMPLSTCGRLAAGGAVIALATALSASAQTNRPVEYPTSWHVEYGSAAPLPAGYVFGRKAEILKKGAVFPPAAQPLACDIQWERDVPVKLRDGVTIYTDVLRPVGGTRSPAIVAWSPYGKTIPQREVQPGVDPKDVTGISKSEGPDAGYWVCHGYAVINPDPRGVGKSEGTIHAWGGVDGDDGYDVIEWIARQPWSNTKVALHGTSWLAMTQWFIAQKRPPHLAAIAPWNGLTDVYRENLMSGGIPDVGFGGAVFGHLAGRGKVERPDLMAQSHPFMDAYWNDKAAKLESITAPAYVVTDVVTDLHRMGTFEGFRRLGSKDKWLRVDNRQEWTDQYDPANEADLLKFFDHYLRGVDNGWEKTPTVRMAVLDPGGADKLNVPYARWPLPNTNYAKLYLDAGAHALATAAPSMSASVNYPGKTGGAQFTHRFTRDTQITGYIKARLWVEAQGSQDMDLFVIVEKLDKDGKVLIPDETSARQYFPVPPPGAHGRLRVSLRSLDPKLSTSYLPVQSFTAPKLLQHGEIVPVDIAIMPQSVLYHAGEQLRFTVSGHEFQAPPANNTTPIAGLGSMPAIPPIPTKNAGVHVVHAGGTYASFLQVPVVSGGL